MHSDGRYGNRSIVRVGGRRRRRWGMVRLIEVRLPLRQSWSYRSNEAVSRNYSFPMLPLDVRRNCVIS